MIDQRTRGTDRTFALGPHGLSHLINTSSTFTRSNGTIIARLYERLTKASRRGGRNLGEQWEMAYRRGVYDAYRALQDELDA